MQQASITFGVGSSQKNGFRDDLYLILERDWNVVDVVENNLAVDSTFKDKDTEGWPGLTTANNVQSKSTDPTKPTHKTYIDSGQDTEFYNRQYKNWAP